MEGESVINTSSATAASSAATPSTESSSQQPTYTTAGTIYKPNLSQPLQAPARRGRSLKWPGHALHPELALLPKSVLARLPLRANTSPSVPILQQYTPLQQNYDRAVSPNSDQDHMSAQLSAESDPVIKRRLAPKNARQFLLEMRLRLETRKLFSGDGYSSPDNDHEPQEEEHKCDDGEDEGDDEDDSNMGALKNMTTKSLQNLASYPNPNQKNAQKALQRGIRVRPSALAASISGVSPGSPPLAALISPTSSAAGEGISSLPTSTQAAQTDTLTGGRGAVDGICRWDGAWSLSTRSNSPAPILSHPTKTKPTSSDLSKIIDKHINGNGTPLPLTAGPPGQRQYRPSTFESTFKALNVQSAQESLTKEDEEALITTTQNLLQRGLDDVSTTAGTLETIPDRDASAGHPKNDVEPQTQVAGSPGGREPPPNSHLFPLRAAIMERQKKWNPDERLIKDVSWRDPRPEVRAMYEPGTDRLSKAALAARNSKLQDCWYFGVKDACSNDSVTGLRQPGSERGGIADDKSHLGENGFPKAIEVDKAIAIATSEHSRSLMEMVVCAARRS